MHVEVWYVSFVSGAMEEGKNFLVVEGGRAASPLRLLSVIIRKTKSDMNDQCRPHRVNIGTGDTSHVWDWAGRLIRGQQSI